MTQTGYRRGTSRRVARALVAANGHAVSAPGRRGIKADGAVRFGVEQVMGTARKAD